MLTEEYGPPLEIRSAWPAALSTFSAFFLCGLTPLVPFIFGGSNAFLVSTLLTAFVFFLIGSAKSRRSTASWCRSGLSTLLVGTTAAALAYAVGMFLRNPV